MAEKRPLSEAQIAQRRAAAPLGWLGYLRKVILAHPGDPDAAALHLTGAMRLAWGFRRTPAGGKTRGVTRAYIERKAAELGLTADCCIGQQDPLGWAEKAI